MKIDVFLKEKLMEFILPTQVSGSFKFDDENEENELINVEAKNGKWMLRSNDWVSVVNENEKINEIELVPNKFYTLIRDDKTFIIYTCPLVETGFKRYAYDNNINLVIGRDTGCNIFYDCNYIRGIICTIRKKDGRLTISNNFENMMIVYLNDEKIIEHEMILKVGDVVNVLGFKIYILPNEIIVNNPFGSVNVDTNSAYLKEIIAEEQEFKEKEVKDIDLYGSNDFFSKSPRIKRNIEKTDIKIDKPPSTEMSKTESMLMTVVPMMSMVSSSVLTLVNSVNQISNGETTWAKSWPSLVTSGLMLFTSCIWPLIVKKIEKHTNKIFKREVYAKYGKYLQLKEEELKQVKLTQETILKENLLNCADCMKIINAKKFNFWNKRSEQNDYLEVRIGIADVPLDIEVDWPEDGFELDQDDLKETANKLIEKYKYIEKAPLGYSFYTNVLTAVMGVQDMCYGFMNNVLLQLMTFYCYDELKFVIFTSDTKAKRWDYLKTSNYVFSNDKAVRYFASNIDDAKEISSIMMPELMQRIEMVTKQEVNPSYIKPHYVIICDSYDKYKKLDLIKSITEANASFGYSLIIIENMINKLPSKCSNFINLNAGISGVLTNSYEKAEMMNFHDEIDYAINMYEFVKVLSNIPVEIGGAAASLPDSISFLEMEKVGKVEQLNVLNRWNTNDSTKSLRAEVGVDEERNWIYLDLHEKFHGPHGLIAGTTGSGKSEFIITYILSMALNYSPNEVSFILIDYKGGGLAGAFENKQTGIRLPHLAGTITNLDVAEMSRTLVSIDSEVKRRQAEFNKARDALGESTIDIYKYQRFYHEGKVENPIPHLFIISDEFAELKAQQPDFMDNLISVARIGRSLGVHLILATQKPSGVVNDQIWSNTKFRVCLKVQDTGDSNEMLKKPDAAMLKQAGRFYLQVGMDEIYVLGQSGWCGAKYFPSDRIQKNVDKSVNFINGTGAIIKSMEAGKGNTQVQAQGEQIAAVLKEIINVANMQKKAAKTLWLDNVPNVVLVDDIEKKYNITHNPYEVVATIGEYDAPEVQKQGVLSYKLLEEGNCIVYGSEGTEREDLISSLLYSISKYHTSEEIQYYILDYGSEALRMFMNMPQCGGMVFNGEDDKYSSFFKMINKKKKKRKKLFADYGGEYKNYLSISGTKLPLKLFIINNFDTINDSDKYFFDNFLALVRDCTRYGIIYIVTASSPSVVGTRILQNFNKLLALKLKDSYSYGDALNGKCTRMPKDIPGRGMCNTGGVHEFQTCSITQTEAELSPFMVEFSNKLKEQNQPKPDKIPVLPEHVMMEDVEGAISDLKKVPIGIYKSDLKVATLDILTSQGALITSNKLSNMTRFATSLIDVINKIKNTSIILIDTNKELEVQKDKVKNYFSGNYQKVIEGLLPYIDKLIAMVDKIPNVVIMFNGIQSVLDNLENSDLIGDFINKVKKCEKISVVLLEDVNKLKGFAFEDWFRALYGSGEGVWIGTGLDSQGVLKTASYNAEYSKQLSNDTGFVVKDMNGSLTRYIDFYYEENGEEDEQ